MIPEKIPTLVLRRYKQIHVAAGAEAAKEGYPWWAAFGYAAAARGSTDAIEVFAAAQDWLHGWSQATNKMEGADPVPSIVDEILETGIHD